MHLSEKNDFVQYTILQSKHHNGVYMQYFSVPQIPQDSSGLQYNFSDFELEEKHSVKSLGILRTGIEFGRISAKLEYSTSLLGRSHVT